MYLKKTTYMEEYEISLATADRQLKFIQSLIGKRYPTDSIIKMGKMLRIRDDVFRDAICFRKRIEAGEAPRFVPNENHIWGEKGEEA